MASLELELAPLASMTTTPTLQRYVKTSATVVGASTGSPITGTVHGTYTQVWVFDFTGVTVGDYWSVVSGVTTPNARPFPTRLDSTSVIVSDSWLYLDMITAAGAVAGPVASSGVITSPVIIGDDYLAANGRAFQWTVAALPGYTLATTTCKFGGAFKDNVWLVSGTVTDAGGGNWTVSFDVAKTDTLGLEEGYYSWSVELISAGGTKVTRVRSGRNVLLVDKQT